MSIVALKPIGFVADAFILWSLLLLSGCGEPEQSENEATLPNRKVTIEEMAKAHFLEATQTNLMSEVIAENEEKAKVFFVEIAPYLKAFNRKLEERNAKRQKEVAKKGMASEVAAERRKLELIAQKKQLVDQDLYQKIYSTYGTVDIPTNMSFSLSVSCNFMHLPQIGSEDGAGNDGLPESFSFHAVLSVTNGPFCSYVIKRETNVYVRADMRVLGRK